MPHLKWICIFLCLVATSTFNYADLDDMESGMTDSQSNNYYNNGYRSYDDGGYKRDVNVLGRQTLLVRQRFTQYDFNSWLAVYSKALAYESFFEMINRGELTPQAVVINPNLQVAGTYFQTGKVLNVDKLVEAYYSVPRGNWLVDLLKEANVLDEDGYILGIDSFSDVFDRK